jgi:peptide/nickel transport system substrate-binding protein
MSPISARIAAALVAGFVMLAATGTSQAQAPKTVTVVGIETTSTDPHRIGGAGDHQFINHVFEGLYGHDSKGRLTPALALSHRTSADGREYTFKLRPNVKFHNGEPFTAEDVRFSWQRSNDPELKNSRAAIVTRNIEDVVVVDDLTVRLKLKAPDASILENLGEYFYIVDKTTLEKVGNAEFGRQPVGTGPLRFVSRRIGEQTELATFAEYWGTKPSYGRLVIRIVNDPQTRIAMLRAGEVDAISSVPPQVARQLEADRNLKLIVRPSFQNIFIVLGTRAPHGQFADPRVRVALNMAIDRKTLIEKVMFGYARPVASLCHMQITGCDTGQPAYPYDPKAARAMLEAAKFDFSRTYIAFGLAPGRVAQSKEVAEAVAFYLSQIGVKTTFEFLEYGAYLGRISGRKFDGTDLFWMGWTDYNNDAMGRLPRSWRTDGALSWHSDPKLDAMIDSANAIVDPKEREAHMKRLFTHAYQNPPSIFLWTTDEIYATRRNVRWDPRAHISWPEFMSIEKD